MSAGTSGNEAILDGTLPDLLHEHWQHRLQQWSDIEGTERLFARDSTLFTGDDEASWLGWLDPDDAARDLGRILQFQPWVAGRGFASAVLLGMGGSSLGPEVLRKTYGHLDGFPDVMVLDSTDPRQILAVAERLDPPESLVMVASKSGSTLETSLLLDHFWERFSSVLGDRAGEHFVAITDPDSSLSRRAFEGHFGHVFLGVESIGGRFSVLSPFGLVPASAMGIDVEELCASASEMSQQCRRIDSATNPGVALGTLLAAAFDLGRDKVTFAAQPAVASLGAWLEQLLAESTGKAGKAILPVDGEPALAEHDLGDDRLYVCLESSFEARVGTDTLPGFDPRTASIGSVRQRLTERGQPVVSYRLDAPAELGAEFYRWQMATSVCGALMGVNPFVQPDVESAKAVTRRLTEKLESGGQLETASPDAVSDALSMWRPTTDDAGAEGTIGAVARELVHGLEPPGYLAVLAYLPMHSGVVRQLQRLRELLQASTAAAIMLGFGPRYLHSTGQAYKGGPGNGRFLFLTCDEPNDLAITEGGLGFGQVKLAQALGDMAVLEERGRYVQRAHLHGDLEAALRELVQLWSSGDSRSAPT